MLNALLLEVSVPMQDKFVAQVICLVDQKDELFLAVFSCATDLLDVLPEVLTKEEVRIPGVDDLQ